ncbi:MAG TPA: AI-2E family transporter [Caldimonas sp.]|jgi:predicted PurR-regulated permease PerM|nr:AI-2E family transporter [Caldimonas sp.]
MTEEAATGKRAAHGADAATAAEEPPRIHLHMPVDVRSVALVVVAVLAGIFALQWAKAILVPILLGVMFSYALTPLVDTLQRWRLPRAIGAGAVLSAIVLVIGWGAFALSDDASALIETLPQVAQKIRHALEGRQKTKPTGSPIEKVQQAANELEQAAQQAASEASASAAASMPASARPRPGTTTTTTTTSAPAPAPTPGGVTRVVVERAAFNVRDYLWTGTIGLFAFLGQTLVVLFVTLFLLASGDTFRRKMVKLAGPTLSQKKITIQALDEVSLQIQRYMLVQLATSVVVGVGTGLAFYALGLNNAATWGVAAGITNLVPYVGAVLVGVGSALVGFIQFDSIDKALLIGASSFAIHAVVGNLLTPWWTGRASRMSPFAVFVGVLTFGWLWGAVGLILGTPILMVVKAVCDRVDELKPVGEFLGA